MSSDYPLYKILVFFIFLLLPQALIAQVNVGTRIGLNTLSGINTEFLKPRDERSYWYFGIGLHHKGMAQHLSCGALPSPLYENNYLGFNFKFGNTVKKVKIKKNGKQKVKHYTNALIYRYFSGTRIDHIPSCTPQEHLSKKYRFKAYDLGYYFIKDADITKKVRFYIAMGFVLRLKSNQLKGSSNASTINTLGFRLLLDLGFRINFSKNTLN